MKEKNLASSLHYNTLVKMKKKIFNMLLSGNHPFICYRIQYRIRKKTHIFGCSFSKQQMKKNLVFKRSGNSEHRPCHVDSASILPQDLAMSS